MKCTSRCVTSSNALVPEKPVRYRTFGRLVSTSASMCAAVSASRSAVTRAGRRSAIDGNRQTLHQTTQCQLIAVRAEAANNGERGVGERRATTLRLARVDVGEMDFHEWNLYSRQRITDGEAGVTVSAGVHERPV